jgi:hypothetical protein
MLGLSRSRCRRRRLCNSAFGQEFAAFMTEPIDVEISPLAVFQHRGTFPRLSLLFFLCCVPRPLALLLSVAGNVLSAKRACSATTCWTR